MLIKIIRVWWSWTGSNRRPPACKAGALPIELQPHTLFMNLISFELHIVKKYYVLEPKLLTFFAN